MSNFVKGLFNHRRANKAAKSQEEQVRKAQDTLKEQYEQQRKDYEPFRQAGLDGLNALNQLSTQQGQQDFYDNYYNSNQFRSMADQARTGALSSAEATGNLGSSSTSNQLARIAPDLGNNALNRQLGIDRGLAGLGFQGASGQANAAGNYGINNARLFQQMGELQAKRNSIPTGFGSFLNQITNFGDKIVGGFLDGLF